MKQGGDGLTWGTKTNLDSAEYPTLTNAPGRLLELARGASNDIDMLENSYTPLTTSTYSLEQPQTNAYLMLPA